MAESSAIEIANLKDIKSITIIHKNCFNEIADLADFSAKLASLEYVSLD